MLVGEDDVMGVAESSAGLKMRQQILSNIPQLRRCSTFAISEHSPAKSPLTGIGLSEHLRPKPRQAAAPGAKKSAGLSARRPTPNSLFGRVAILLVGSPARARETVRNQAVLLAGLARFFARIARALAPAFARSGRL